MIPIRDENPTLRTPLVTIALLAALALTWVFVQGAGFDEARLVASICDLGLVPGELTGRAPLGEGVAVAPGLACVVDADPLNRVTPLTSMFLHGGWAHLLGNALFLWVFGNNVEDSMGRLRFFAFYLLCGIVAAGAQILAQPASPVPMVGASGAIAGVLGAYLVLYPRVLVHVLLPLPFFWTVIRVRAYLMLLWWIGLQLLAATPELLDARSKVSSGVAFFAHIGGFTTGVVLVKLFARPSRVRQRDRRRHELHPGHP